MSSIIIVDKANAIITTFKLVYYQGCVIRNKIYKDITGQTVYQTLFQTIFLFLCEYINIPNV